MDQSIKSMTPWRLATKVAFRFCLLYFGLYVLVHADDQWAADLGGGRRAGAGHQATD